MNQANFQGQQIEPADAIIQLPTDQNPPSHNEVQIVDTLFQEKQTAVEKFLTGSKDVLLIGIIFLIFSMPQVDDMIKKFIPISATSLYILLLIKTLMFMLIYFVLKNMYLVRKK